MKKLIIIIFMLIGWMSGFCQDHSDYVYNFRLPGTSGSNFDFSPLDDSVAIAKTEGWNVLVMGYYNISHYNSASEYKSIVERFEKKDSSIIISFFKEGSNFDFDQVTSSAQKFFNNTVLMVKLLYPNLALSFSKSRRGGGNLGEFST